MALEIVQFPCLSDNYGYLIQDQKSGIVATIDTPDVEAINDALGQRGWKLDIILNTHHHYDHAGGNLALKDKWNCKIIGPKQEAARIPGIDQQVGDGDVIEIGHAKARIYDTPGHTLGHIVFHFEEDGLAFVGDTVFALGCGRLFEGTPEQMWSSLSKIVTWPENTMLYCAHEYTEANAQFALSVDGDNHALKKRSAEIKVLRAKNTPTVPTRLGDELATNPFLRANRIEMKQALNMEGANDVEVFAEIRKRKDNF